MTQDFGTVAWNGNTLRLQQQAYCDNYGTDGAVRYYAHAIDENGNCYRVAWDTTAAWDAREPEEANDESDACDWDNPVEIILA